MGHMKYERSKTGPCLLYNWDAGSLCCVMFLLQADDCLITERKEKVIEAKDRKTQLSDCKDFGEMMKYTGFCVERGDGGLHLTRPVQLQKFEDVFDLTTHQSNPKIPIEPTSVLS